MWFIMARINKSMNAIYCLNAFECEHTSENGHKTFSQWSLHSFTIFPNKIELQFIIIIKTLFLLPLLSHFSHSSYVSGSLWEKKVAFISLPLLLLFKHCIHMYELLDKLQRNWNRLLDPKQSLMLMFWLFA